MAHAVADFALFRRNEFSSWHTHSQFIVALQTPSLESLELLHEKALSRGLDVIAFREPDLGDQLTSLAFVPHASNRKLLSNLPLAGKKAGKLNKHTGSQEAVNV